MNYQPPASIDPDTFALQGNWKVGAQQATAGTGAKLQISYLAKVVYLVIGGEGHGHGHRRRA